jgi:eukaryotic-like serine/threonine-protein kinase
VIAPRSLQAGGMVGGKYRLVRRIGAGGMGEVWIARNRTTGAEVAVKMGLGAATPDDSALRFRHEARLGAMLSHRSIVRIFDLVEEDDGALILVMELLRGETLERYLHRRGPLPTAEAIAIAVPILSALAHAHDSGIVHRDVTPANVFLAVDPDGHVTPKLLDFGIAKIPTASPTRTIDGRALGTPAYMAPERIRERADVDGRSDLFSVGVLLYEMLAGACPFAAGTPAASLAAVLEVVVDPDPRIDPRVWLEIRRALSKRPYERAPSAGAMATDLLAASRMTEATLVEALRNGPLAGGLSGDDAAGRAQTQTVTGHSLGDGATDPTTRRGRSLAWIAGGVVVCAGLAGTIAAVRVRTPMATASATSAVAAASAVLSAPIEATLAPPPKPPVEAMPASSSATQADVPLSSASSLPVTKAVPPPRPSSHPVRPPRPRPVATTPGF